MVHVQPGASCWPLSSIQSPARNSYRTGARRISLQLEKKTKPWVLSRWEIQILYRFGTVCFREQTGPLRNHCNPLFSPGWNCGPGLEKPVSWTLTYFLLSPFCRANQQIANTQAIRPIAVDLFLFKRQSLTYKKPEEIFRLLVFPGRQEYVRLSHFPDPPLWYLLFQWPCFCRLDPSAGLMAAF